MKIGSVEQTLSIYEKDRQVVKDVEEREMGKN